MTDFESEQIKHQIYLEQYKNGQANKIIALLDTADKRITDFIRKTDGVYTKERYKEIANELKAVSKALRDKIKDGTDIDGIIEYELKKQQKLLKLVDGVENVSFVIPTVETVKTAALFKPAASKTFEGYLNGIESGLYDVWDSNIRTGYLTGDTTYNIVKKVLGSAAGNEKLADAGAIRAFRNSLFANTKTMLQSFANEARNQVYEKNEKYFVVGRKYKYLACLDRRTCLVCASLDGQYFAELKDAPQLPQHLGCRCLLLCNVDGMESLDDGAERAAEGEPVAANVTYSEWLAKQSDEVQKEVLGLTRYKLYKSGVEINQFIDSGKVLTFNQLKDKLPKSFEELAVEYTKKIVDNLSSGNSAEALKYQEKLKALQEQEAKAEGLLLPKEENIYSQTRKDAALRSDDREFIDSKVRKTSGDIWRTLSPEEKEVAYQYTSSSDDFNMPLSGYKKSWDNYVGVENIDFNNEVGEKIRTLEKIINKSSYDFDMWVQRGSDGRDIAAHIGKTASELYNMSEQELQSLVGREYINNAFTSTSADQKGGLKGSYRFNIFVPKGTKILYTEPFSAFGGNPQGIEWDGIASQKYLTSELEMLIQKGAMFKITKVVKSGEQVIFDLDLLVEKGYHLLK